MVVLMKGRKIPTQDILDKVEAIVSAKNRRPLTDNVQVSAPAEVSYNINLNYYISVDRQAEELILKSTIEAIMHGNQKNSAEILTQII
ncbi:baseplate J/gp47 family protein [Tepidimicrobium xylanilyticum]|nr:baseplate J/gp47 family protein [Tepidimicrobium xylanilyticum]